MLEPSRARGRPGSAPPRSAARRRGTLKPQCSPVADLRSEELDFFPRHDEFVSEVDRKLGWELDGYTGHQAIIEHPIPFARYAIEYEFHAAAD